MANFYRDNPDLRYYVEKGVDWEALFEATEIAADVPFGDVEEARSFYRDILELLGGFAANEVAPRAAALDRAEMALRGGEVDEPAELRELCEKAREIDLHGLPVPREFGGINAPILLYMLNGELVARADVSVMTHFGFHAGIAMAMLVYAIHEGAVELEPDSRTLRATPFDEAIREIAAGRAWGSMDITEPEAGSDMAALRTKGEQDAEGNWYVTGQKIFITSGHGKYHFVIARTEDPAESPGLEGLSLFLVQAYDEDGRGNRVRDRVTLGRVEDKLGHHASPTCTIDFDRAPARLIGERGQGFKLMLLLMNNARISVGFESLGLCEAAYRSALTYARQRPSMGKTIDQHELLADRLDEMQSDIEGLRALAIECAVTEELAQRSKIHRLAFGEGSRDGEALDARIREKTQRSRFYTPLLKYLGAEKAVEMARRAVQMHGGVGYTTDYDAEKLMRDALVLPIYEGTSEIQCLMATKDNLLWIMRNPKAFAAEYAAAVRDATTSRDPNRRRVAQLERYAYAAERHLMTRVVGDKLGRTWKRPLGEWRTELTDWDPKRDFGPALLHAERLTRMLCDVAIAGILERQAAAHAERQEVLDRYLERALVRCKQLHEEITTTGERLLEKLAGQRDTTSDVEAEPFERPGSKASAA